MSWFANKGQIIQILLALIAIMVALILGWSIWALLIIALIGILVVVYWVISQRFPSRPTLAITKSATATGVKYPLKLNLRVTNTQPHPVAIESQSFEPASTLSLSDNAKRIPGTRNQYRPKFAVWEIRDKSTGKLVDWQYEDRCILEPGKDILAWVPIDPAIGGTALTAAVNANSVGVWRYRCAWFGERIRVFDYKDSL